MLKGLLKSKELEKLWLMEDSSLQIIKTTIDKTIHGLDVTEDFVENWKFESLWVNDQEAIRSRIPSSWTLNLMVGVPSSTMKFLRDLNEDELHQVNIVVFHYWSTTRARISSIDLNSNTITFTAHSPNNDNNKGIEDGNSYFYLDSLNPAFTKP